jgi:hypothetical protein
LPTTGYILREKRFQYQYLTTHHHHIGEYDVPSGVIRLTKYSTRLNVFAGRVFVGRPCAVNHENRVCEQVTDSGGRDIAFVEFELTRLKVRWGDRATDGGRDGRRGLHPEQLLFGAGFEELAEFWFRRASSSATRATSRATWAARVAATVSRARR